MGSDWIGLGCLTWPLMLIHGFSNSLIIFHFTCKAEIDKQRPPIYKFIILGGRDPSTFVIISLTLHISRKLDQRQRTQDSNWALQYWKRIFPTAC